MALTEAFTWGRAGAKLTPEEIARQREIADALLSQAGDTSPVEHWSEGAARVVNALGGVLKERRANSAEQGNATASQGRIAALLGGLGGQGASPVAAGVPVAAGAPSGSAPAPVVGENADYIRSGLLKRGLPEHVADAFVMNFQDESGLNPGINEANPIVPGSRGGYGLYQLTGPRRRAYEEFAQQRGAPLDDVDAQLDFMMAELQGPESAAAKSILSAPDTGTAAAAIVNDFLRPAESHRASRVARYTGGGGGTQVASLDPSIGLPPEQPPALAAIDNLTAAPSPMGDPGTPVTETPEGQRALAQMLSGASMTGGDPMVLQGAPVPTNMADRPIPPAVQQVAQALPAQAPAAPVQAPGGINPAILESLSSPYATPQERQIAGILLEQQMQNSDPMRQLQMQKLQREINATPERKTIVVNGRLVDAQTGQEIAKYEDPAKPTADMQEYEYAKRQGFGGSFVDFQLAQKKAGATSVTTNVGEGDKFYENLDKKNAETFSALSDEGLRGRGKLAQIDRLEGLMATAPQGAVGVLKQAAGEYGINTEGLSDIQAAQALINELVPQQRQPGSGPMSDADLALFKQSLPRLINQPGGNKMILDTMRGITQYQIKMGEIADAVADREMSPKDGREAIRALANPLEGFGKTAPKGPVKIDGYTIEEVE